MAQFYYYILFVLFSFIIYAMIRDENVIEFINQLLRLIQSYILRIKTYLTLPRVNFISKWMIERKYYKIVKELEKELKSKSNS